MDNRGAGALATEVMNVPLLDLTRGDEALTRESMEAIARVVKSGYFILGPEVEAFEKEAAAMIGAKHALGVSSGTDALLLALMALDIGAGDEVICPTFTFFATAGTIWRSGAKPVFIDCAPDSFNSTAFEKALTPKTKALMPVHLFGEAVPMEPLLALAKSKGLAVIEDAAQAIGSTHNGHGAGTFGEFGCFSFFPSKNLGAFGDAGLVTTNDDKLAERARLMRTHGMHPKYYHHMVGGNFRIDAMQAAILRVRAKRLAGWTAQRQKNAALYAQLLADVSHIVLPTIGAGHIVNQFVIRVPGKRDALQAHLKQNGVASEIYYPVPMHAQACFAELGHKPADFPRAEKLAAEVLALPIFPELREEEIRFVAEQIRAFAA